MSFLTKRKGKDGREAMAVSPAKTVGGGRKKKKNKAEGES